MALLMGAVMAIIMLGYMLNMYKSRTVNIGIFTGAARGDAPVAAAIAPGAGATRGVIKLHGRLLPMNVRYQTLAGDGFELSILFVSSRPFGT